MTIMIDLKKTVIVAIEEHEAFVNNLPIGLEEIVIHLDGEYEVCECDPDELNAFPIGQLGNYEMCLNCGCVIDATVDWD
jgi:hypothetical protein